MVGDRYILVWPEDQVALAPTEASICGSPAHVSRIDRSTFVACSRLDAVLHVCHPRLVNGYSMLSFLGMTSSPSFVREPEGNGVAKRFIRSRKENLRWVRHFVTLAELVEAL